MDRGHMYLIPGHSVETDGTLAAFKFILSVINYIVAFEGFSVVSGAYLTRKSPLSLQVGRKILEDVVCYL